MVEYSESARGSEMEEMEPNTVSIARLFRHHSVPPS